MITEHKYIKKLPNSSLVKNLLKNESQIVRATPLNTSSKGTETIRLLENIRRGNGLSGHNESVFYLLM